MKAKRVSKKVMIYAEKNFTGKDKLLDYYIKAPGIDAFYAFSRRYSDNTYRMCKNGMMLNDLLGVRTRDTAVMRLVEHAKLMLSYFVEEYNLPLSA